MIQIVFFINDEMKIQYASNLSEAFNIVGKYTNILPMCISKKQYIYDLSTFNKIVINVA